MPINKETIISVFDDKLTLMQWLKTINKALEDAVLTGVEITKKGNATLSFKFTFEDGTFLETNDLVLQQGESVVNAYIQNGHLYLTLSNGTNLDAGNVKPVSNFSIDANQHLIVNYADGTSQDLGAIFNGNININGTLNATKVTGNEIIENPLSYTMRVVNDVPNLDIEAIYASVCKNGNKLTFVWFLKLNRTGDVTGSYFNQKVYVQVPQVIADKLYPYAVGGLNLVLDTKKVSCYDTYNTSTELDLVIFKYGQTLPFNIYGLNNLTLNKDYLVRIEETFLLSDNLAQ